MRKLKFVLILFLVLSGVYLLINRGFYNLDHLNKGKLVSVVISENNCISKNCDADLYPMFITDHASMKEIESAIFMKPTTNFMGYTKQGLLFHLKFVYQHGTVDLDVGYYQENGNIKYHDKHRDYTLRKGDIEILRKYLIIRTN